MLGCENVVEFYCTSTVEYLLGGFCQEHCPMKTSRISANTFLRVGLVASLLALDLISGVLVKAQCGPDWEVSQGIMRVLEAVPILAIVLVLISGVALFRASYDGALPRLAKRGSLTVLMLSVLLILIAICAEPAQWRGNHFIVSTLTTVLFFPVLAASGFTFWLLGFRFVPSGYRSGKKAVLLVIGSTIAGFLFVTAVFVLLG
jgi:hypothetical protein